ncbi:restriction endonuclease subunit M [Williamsoniiplasma somnilux]|uniref:Site-specific DNA-methyltransferase (adenine-specific) n=1 Tax=Williamsoniiplasma somnilux TaxID=215578 RepID=A0A2K8NYU0_9MOLU|nr:Dam family site-specific DNA-(adenine-N6)-methyltransferase [Williamsoniiplasma somnilux]ATZ18982.1 restriction endonuclease subunit M [Williamsoniiplasma somnilux]
MKPLIKWVGGKRRFIKYIEEEIPDNINNYFEPFAGSAALYFHLKIKNSNINDLNTSLIDFYKTVRDNPEKLLDEINKTFNNSNPQQHYYDLRMQYNEEKKHLDKIRRSALFFYLNKVGFNGIYRVNLQGNFNVPIGKSKTYFIPTKNDFNEASKLLKSTKLTSKDYKEIVRKAGFNDLIYLDPPYYPDDSSKFVGYTEPSFGKKQHEELIEECYKAWKKGCTILISNSNSLEFREKINYRFGESVICKNIFTKRSINPNSIDKKRFVENLYIIKQR